MSKNIPLIKENNKINGNLQWHFHEVALHPLFPDRISVDFCGGRKTGEPGEKPSEQGREPTTNSIHIWRRVRESNPGHSGDRSHYCAILLPPTKTKYLVEQT